MQHTLKTYQEIAHFIPSESIYHTHYRTNKNAKFILIEGDYHFDKPIDLFEPDQYFGIEVDWDNGPLFAIVITGNATAGNISCSELDFGTGLLVLGNLTAENMVVSGQEIFVAGDLNVKGWFWGNYNHGELVVLGEIHSTVFLETDYGYDSERFAAQDRVFIPHLLLDTDEDFDSYPNRLTALLKPEFIYDEETARQNGDIWSWKSWINEGEVFKALENRDAQFLNTPEQITENLKLAEERITIFPDKEISPKNLFRLTYPPYFNLMSYQSEVGADWAQFWDTDDVFYRVFYKESANLHGLFIQETEDESGLRFLVDFEDNAFGIWVKTPETGEFTSFSAESDPEKYAILTKYWQYFLNRWEEIVFHLQKYSEAVNQETFNEIFYGKEIVAIYHERKRPEDLAMELSGRYSIQMYHSNNNQRDRISIIDWDYYVDDEEDKNPFFYHYEWDAETGRVLLLQQDGNGYEFAPYEISFARTDLYRKATRLFKKIKGWFEVD